MGFTNEDRQKLNLVFTKIESIGDSVDVFQSVLTKAIQIIDTQAKHICFLNSQINVSNYRMDAQQQYNRMESLRAINLDPAVHGNDAVKIMMDIAKEIEAKATDDSGNKVTVGLTKDHIQRCHFLGDKKNKLICKFIPYKMRMKILLNKKVINGAKTGKFKDVFICEDLTPMRNRLVWYIKQKCKTKFTKLHTRNGVIRVKKEGHKSDSDPWLLISNPDELFPHLDPDDVFDIKLFNKDLHGFKLLPDFPELNFLDELLEELKPKKDDDKDE